MNQGSRSQPLRLLKGSEQQPTDHSDAELIEAVKAGNPQSAVMFHDRIIAVVMRTISRLLGNRDPDYDDVVQQALIELVLAVDRFRGQCPLDAWSSIISARAVYRHLRRRKLERRLFVLEGADNVEQIGRATSNSAMLRMLIRRIEAHLHAIEPKKAWTFILHDVHGYNLAEIAEITGASQTAVQSRLVRARKELHARIRASGELASQLSEYAIEGGE
jgi:RNA polymerase sigma factor (sigma-70 family)